MAERLIKRWDDWSAGVGYPIDDGRTPGMYRASGLLGLPGELRVAPLKNTVTVGIDESHHYQYFFEEPTAATLPLLDASSTDTDTAVSSGDAHTLSWTAHTTAANNNRMLIVAAYQGDASGAIPTSVTYDGVSLTLLTSRVTGDGLISIWYLANPATGTATINVNWAVTRGVHLGVAETWYKVAQTGAFYLTNTAVATSGGPATVNVSGGVGADTSSVVIDFAACGDSVQTMTVGALQTQIANITAGDGRFASSYEPGTGSAITMSWTLGASTD